MNPVPNCRAALATPNQRDVTLAEATAVRQQVIELLASQRPTRLVIDATPIQLLPKPSNLFDFVKWLAHTLPRGARVALVVRPEQVRHARLIERVARKAGSFLTYFIDRQKAQRWVEGPTFPRHYFSAGSGQAPATTTVTTVMEATYVH